MVRRKKEKAAVGEAISFLPSDMDRLFQNLKLLRAEFHAGNETNRNELVAVLDELKRPKVVLHKKNILINSSL